MSLLPRRDRAIWGLDGPQTARGGIWQASTPATKPKAHAYEWEAQKLQVQGYMDTRKDPPYSRRPLQSPSIWAGWATFRARKPRIMSTYLRRVTTIYGNRKRRRIPRCYELQQMGEEFNSQRIRSSRLQKKSLNKYASKGIADVNSLFPHTNEKQSKMYSTALQLCYWPNMKKGIELSVCKWAPCQEQRSSNAKPTLGACYVLNNLS